jgi:uncharacterized protein (TIGR02246 family)
MKLDDSSRQFLARNARWIVVIIVGLTLTFVLPGYLHRNALPEGLTSRFEIAFTKHDLEGCLAIFSDDAQILPEHGSVVSGREAIIDFLKNTMTPVVSFNTDTDLLMVRDDIAVEQGHYTVRNIRRGENIEMGKYMHIWRKEHGEWKLYRVIFNTDVAPKGEGAVEGQPETIS